MIHKNISQSRKLILSNLSASFKCAKISWKIRCSDIFFFFSKQSCCGCGNNMMQGRPAGFSDSEDGSDFEYEFEAPVAGLAEVPATSKVIADPWADLAAYKSLPKSMTAGKMTVADFKDAISQGNLKKVEEFIDGSTQNVLEGLGGMVRPVFVAAENGDVDLLRLLCRKGASLEPNESDGTTLLMAICAVHSILLGGNKDQELDCRLTECAQLLLDEFRDRGLDFQINRMQNQNMTALM